MITLPNGDKWIVDDAELKAVNWDKSLLKEVSPEVFIEGWLSAHASYLPRKLTFKFGPDGYWDCNFCPYKEILGSFAVGQIETCFGDVYEMPNGKVYLIYEGADCGGYDVETKVKEFENRNAYLKHVSVFSM